MHVQVHEEVRALRTALMTAQADAHRLEVLAGERAAAQVRRMHACICGARHAYAGVDRGPGAPQDMRLPLLLIAPH